MDDAMALERAVAHGMPAAYRINGLDALTVSETGGLEPRSTAGFGGRFN